MSDVSLSLNKKCRNKPYGRFPADNDKYNIRIPTDDVVTIRETIYR